MFRLLINGQPSPYRMRPDKLVGYDNYGERVEFSNGINDSVKWLNLKTVEVYDNSGNIVLLNNPADKVTGYTVVV